MKKTINTIAIMLILTIVYYSFVPMHVFANESSYHRSTAKGQATVEMWNMIQRYSDPNYFKGRYRKKVEHYEHLGKLSGKKYKSIALKAKKITAGCKTDYQKMETVAKYIATRSYYDYPKYTGKRKSTNLSAYNVWKNKRTICQGYANLYYAMLYSLRIPCMYVHGNNHVYNAAYDKASRRWVFTDVSWCSGNKVTPDGRWVAGAYKPQYFDMSLDYMLGLSSHEIYHIEGVLKNNVYYELSHGFSGKTASRYVNRKTWHWTTTCQNKKRSTLKISYKIGKYKVTEIGYDSFYACPHIKKVFIPTTIKKIGEFSFCLKDNRKIVKTKIVTKVSKKKLRLNKNYTWWARRTVIVKQ